MTLKELEGNHILQELCLGEKQGKDSYGYNSVVDFCAFKLDGVWYLAEEDPDDGYRSYCKDLEVLTDEEVKDLGGVHTKLPDIPVTCCMSDESKGDYPEEEILLFYEVGNGSVGPILIVGTKEVCDYYPSAVFEWCPEILSMNGGRLKSCPFCGCEKIEIRPGYTYGGSLVRCPRCYVCLERSGRQKAIEVWNSRV